MFESLLNAFRAPDIRRRILYVLGMLVVIRFLAHVPVPGVDAAQLEQFFQNNALFGVLDLLSGGGLSSFSVIALGVNPYINASIIMQLMTGVIPSLQALSREGEYGRNKINQYTRYLSVPLSALQAYGFLALLNSQGVLSSGFDLGNGATLTQIATLTAGSIALDVARRADHREGHRQRHQLHHLRRHREPGPGRDRRLHHEPERRADHRLRPPRHRRRSP